MTQLTTANDSVLVEPTGWRHSFVGIPFRTSTGAPTSRKSSNLFDLPDHLQPSLG